ncbi:hypothetical protein HpCK35_31300 [Helicobacter pylori]
MFYFESNNVVSGPFGSTLTSESYRKDGICFIRVQDIKGGFFVEKESLVKISESDNNKIKHSQLRYGDFVISKVGNSIGYVAEIPEDINICNISENNIGLKTIGLETYTKKYILVFLNSKYGQLQIWRRISGNAQPKINVADFTKIKIPILPIEFQLEIQNLVKDSHKALEESKGLYKKAEETLYLELGLDPKNPLQSLLDSKTNNPTNSLNISIHTLKESFLKTGRLDSEYYQKKYEINEKIIMNKKYTVLDNLVNITKSIEPGSNLYKNKGIPFIRVANLTQYGLSEGDVFLDEKDFFPQYLQILYPKKDTILFSKDGSVGIAYCVKEDKEVVTSSAILHLNIKDKENILPEYLTLFLNSIFAKLQAQRDCGGSIISHWRIEDIKKVLVAILDIKTQEKIAKYIQESFNLRKKSKQLLDNAKIKVEEQIQGKT